MSSLLQALNRLESVRQSMERTMSIYQIPNTVVYSTIAIGVRQYWRYALLISSLIRQPINATTPKMWTAFVYQAAKLPKKKLLAVQLPNARRRIHITERTSRINKVALFTMFAPTEIQSRWNVQKDYTSTEWLRRVTIRERWHADYTNQVVMVVMVVMVVRHPKLKSQVYICLSLICFLLQKKVNGE